MLASKLVKSSLFLLGSLLLLSFATPSNASLNFLDKARADLSGAQKVDLAVYYESLCPACQDFIVDQLGKVFSKGLLSIVNLRLVPWGNAEVYKNGTISCQHGQDECEYNTLGACIINIWPDVTTHFNYIRCVEDVLSEDGNKDIDSCFKTEGDLDSIKSCFESGLGAKLEQQHRKETESLKPPHEYVPWVVVNNVPLEDDINNFVAYVCKAYKGQLPPACKSKTLGLDSAVKKYMARPFCHVTDENTLTNSTSEKGTGQHEIVGRKMKIINT